MVVKRNDTHLRINEMVKFIFYKANSAKTNKWLHKLIAWRTHGPYSHCEIYFTDSKLRFSADIQTNKCRFKPLQSIDPQHWDTIDTNLDGNLVFSMCNKYKGAKYDLFGIIFNFILPLNTHDRKNYFCSEVMVKVLQDCYYDKVMGLRAHKITPNKLYRILKG